MHKEATPEEARTTVLQIQDYSEMQIYFGFNYFNH